MAIGDNLAGMGGGPTPATTPGASPLFSGAQPGVAPNAGGSNVLQMLALIRALQGGGGARPGAGGSPAGGGLGNLMSGKGAGPVPAPGGGGVPAPPTGSMG